MSQPPSEERCLVLLGLRIDADDQVAQAVQLVGQVAPRRTDVATRMGVPDHNVVAIRLTHRCKPMLELQ